MNTSFLIKPTIVLAATAFISAFLLSHVDAITKPNIEAQKIENEKAALSIVLPEYKVGSEQTATVNGKPFRYWIGEKQPLVEQPAVNFSQETETAKAYAFISSGLGYSGYITLMAGVDEAGSILGISVINQAETPGLGARCVEVASTRTLWDALGESSSTEEKMRPWFQEQFVGLTSEKKILIEKLGDWTPEKSESLKEKNAITAITGATITGRGIIEAIEKGSEALKRVLAEQSKVTVANEQSENVTEAQQ